MRFAKISLILLVIACIMYNVYGCVQHYHWEAERADPVKRREMDLRECAEYVSEDPNNPERWCTWGNLLVNLGRDETDPDKKRAFFEEARQKGEAATRCDAKHAEAWMVWGHAFYNLSELESDKDRKREELREAASKYKEAVRLKPDYANAWANWACMTESLAELDVNP